MNSPEKAAVQMVSVAELLAEVERLTSRMRPRSGMTFEIDCPPDITIETDRELLAAIIVELFGNAAKFAPVARVRAVVRSAVMSERPGSAVSLAIIDDGPGFSLSQFPGLMHEYPLAQLRALNRNGIGLFLVASLCKRLGGNLVLATAPGKGVAAMVTLPVTRREPSAVPSNDQIRAEKPITD